jgi:hypothetical protein
MSARRVIEWAVCAVQAADNVSRAMGRTVAALFVDPVQALRQGQGVTGAACMAITAVPTAMAAPVAAAASAVQYTCVALQQALHGSQEPRRQ